MKQAPTVDASAAGAAHSRRGVRRRAWLLFAVALAFYLGFIALSIYRSRH
jgi:hypothetical protein